MCAIEGLTLKWIKLVMGRGGWVLGRIDAEVEKVGTGGYGTEVLEGRGGGGLGRDRRLSR